jgi:protein-tyrosine phosphatase
VPPAQPFRILVVCTGNICRSPMAQALLTHGLRKRLGDDADASFVVTSAGTHGLSGWEIEPAAQQVLDELGVTLDPFTAREMLEAHVGEADLVLGATREHRAAAVTMAPRVSGRTFTLRELARLAGSVDPAAVEPTDDPAARARRMVAEAAQHRGYVRPDDPRDDDVADPYRRPTAAFQQAGQEIQEAVDAIVDLLVGGR